MKFVSECAAVVAILIFRIRSSAGTVTSDFLTSMAPDVGYRAPITYVSRFIVPSGRCG